MTERIYYTDPSCCAFDATVTRALAHEGRPAVVLDRSAFYPTSGGQPFDTGSLGPVRVLDTVEADDILHVILRKTIARQQEALAAHEAARLVAAAPPVGGIRVVVETMDGWDAAGLKSRRCRPAERITACG